MRHPGRCGLRLWGVSIFPMAEGYVKMYRSVLDWEWYSDEAATRLFIHLLLTVNYLPGRFRGEEVEPGSTITSLDNLAGELGWNRSKLRRTLDKLKATGEVTTKTTNHWTTVTLGNWAKYQGCDQQTDQQTANRPTNNRPTSEPTTGNNRRRKEEEEGKNTEGRKRPRTQTWTLEQFQEAFRAVVLANPDRLAKSERTPFYGYWTEADLTGRMRFQSEKFFDVGRRMDTWQRNNFGKTMSNRLGAQMTKAEADAALVEIRKAHGIAPGGLVETQLIPKEVLEAFRRP